MPSLLFTLLVTFLIAPFILTPQHLERSGKELLSALLFMSNFFFIGEAAYFGTPAQFKPLLHTWSLAIEEQFYLFWPIVLFSILTLRNRKIVNGVIYLLLIGVVASILLATLFSESVSTYYFTPFRAYEFFFGIIIAVIPRRGWQDLTIVRELSATTGVILIGLSVYQFDQSTPFPSYYALLPTIGAALIIQSNNPRIAGWAFRHPVSVWIGLVSYPLYLLHWPIIVFTNYVTPTVSVFFDVCLLLSSLLAATFVYYYVETPFRLNRKSVCYRYFWHTGIVVSVILASFSVYLWQSDGMAWRYDVGKKDLLDSFLEVSQIQDNENYAKNNILETGSLNENLRKVLIFGDSHSRDLFTALTSNPESQLRFQVGHASLEAPCFAKRDYEPSLAKHILGLDLDHMSERCVLKREFVNRSIRAISADAIIIATFNSLEDLFRIPTMIDFYQEAAPDAQIYVLGANLLPHDPPTLFMLNSDASKINQILYTYNRIDHIYTDTRMKQIAEANGATFIDVYGLVCDVQKSSCIAVNDSGELLYLDSNHWTFKGAQHYGKQILPIIEGSIFK